MKAASPTIMDSTTLPRRRPVWQAMSELFLDTELDSADRARIARALEASGYSLAELDQILWGEVCPVLCVNLLCVAGEWSAFDMQAVEHRIVSRPAGRVRRWMSYHVGGKMVRQDWQRIREILASPK